MKPIPKVVVFAAVTGLMWLMYWVAVGQHSTSIDNDVEEELPLAAQLIETSLCALLVGGASTLAWWAVERARR